MGDRVDLNTLSLGELFAALTADGSLDRLIVAALAEDFGWADSGSVGEYGEPSPQPTPTPGQGRGSLGGDVTSEALIDPGIATVAQMRARAAGVAAGLAAVPRILEIARVDVTYEGCSADGDVIDAGAVLGHFRGRLVHVLGVERTILNLVSRLSGIATLTAKYVEAVLGTKALICDTRKTTPGLRSMEKYAVRCGGGTLHRLGLHDAMLIKDNHLAHLSGENWVEAVAAAAVRGRARHDLRFVEVEVDRLEQLEALLGLDDGVIDIVLLDNMPPEVLEQAVRMRDERKVGVLLEASGGVTLETVRAVAETGVDRIAVGALTHGAASLDIGLDIAPAPGHGNESAS